MRKKWDFDEFATGWLLGFMTCWLVPKVWALIKPYLHQWTL